LIFFPPNFFFFGILEKRNLFSEQKKFWREKINLAKTILPFHSIVKYKYEKTFFHTHSHNFTHGGFLEGVYKIKLDTKTEYGGF
jgi:hypothetical protein